MLSKGIVMQAVKDNFQVLVNEAIINCSASQKIKLTNKIVCGDHVEVDLKNNYITNILERKNFITRPKTANVDKAFITMSFKEPDLSTLLLDKLILFYEFHKIEPILVFTKKDLVKKNEYDQIISDYKNAGYQIIQSDINNFDSKPFESQISNRVVIFAGQSGVGKSTILNNLLPDLNIATNEISHALNRGKHTTTKNTLYRLFDGLVCDTPGFSSIQQVAIKKVELAKLFKDFAKLSKECKFSDCLHIKETVCKIKEEVEKTITKNRYNNYVSIVNDIKGK